MTNTQDRQNRRTRSGLIVGAATLTLAACGNGTAGNFVPASGAPTPVAPQGAFGTIAMVAASNVEVQNPQSGQVTVNFSSSTTFDTIDQATLQDVTVGSCVTVTPAANAPAGQTVPAGTVLISQPAANGCTRAGTFGGGASGGSRQDGGANPSRRVRPSGQPGPDGPNGPRGVGGSVTAANGNTFTVHNTVPGNGNVPADITVTIDSNTLFTKSVSADAHALAVGKCVLAAGPTDDTGAVTARSMTITTPGPNGCAVSDGRQRRSGQNGGGNG
jgi:hypothetical protein